MDLNALEHLARASIDEDNETYLTEVGFDFESVGLFCGNLAMAGVESLGVVPESDRGRELGAVVTTAAICAFETAVRAVRSEVALQDVTA